MAFAINTANVPRINTYADALRFHDKASQKPWRNGGEDFPFPGKRVRQYGVRKLADGSIAFRYHSTDVVTWHPDDSCTLDPWNSQSTQAFANHLLPRHVYTTSQCSKLVTGGWQDGWVYPLSGKVRIGGPDDAIITGARFAIERVNRKRAKVALARTRYAEYREWYGLMRPMLGDGFTPDGTWLLEHEALGLLADEQCWHKLMTCRWGHLGHPDNLREIIYRKNYSEVYCTEYADRLPARSNISKWRVCVA